MPSQGHKVPRETPTGQTLSHGPNCQLQAIPCQRWALASVCVPASSRERSSSCECLSTKCDKLPVCHYHP
jgi:hypothetical protein